MRAAGSPDLYAGLVLLLHDPNAGRELPGLYGHHVMMVARNVHGPVGYFRMSFDERTMKFKDCGPEDSGGEQR